MVHELLHSEKTRFAGGALEGLLQHHGVDEPAELVNWLQQLLLAVPVPPNVRRQLIQLAGGDREINRNGIIAVIHAMSTLPEFQLS